MTGKEKKSYFIWFSVLFPVMLALAYAAFLVQGKSLIKTGDSIQQHCRVFLYYGNYLRRLLSLIFAEHRLELPEWDFSIGYGSNILSTFHYYIIGDPLSLLSVFASGKNALYLYQLLLVFRHYLAGIAFSCYCIYMGKKNRAALLAGAYTYVFCVHALNMGVWHPFFLNPMIDFPLVLIGVEKIFRKEKTYILIGAVFLSAVSNFYFFYMIAALTVIYVLVRCAFCFGLKSLKKAGSVILQTGLYSFVGVLMSAAILVPVLLVFLKDCRSGAGHDIPLLFGADYYPALLASFTGAVKPEARTLLTYGAAALPAVLLLFMGKSGKKGAKEQRTLFCLGVLFLLFPMAGHVLNGFSYVANRWTWGFGLLAAFILISSWEAFFEASLREAAVLGAAMLAYGLVCLGYESMRVTLVLLAAVWLLIVLCAVRKSASWRRFSQTAMLMIVLAGIGFHAYELYTGEDTNLIRYFYTQEGVRNVLADNPDTIVQELSEETDGFFRYTGSAVQENSTINSGTSDTQFYWSLSNGNIARYFLQTETLVWGLYYYRGLDDRTALNTLAGCRYYVSRAGKKAYVPYGYTFLEERGGYDVYENQYALPLAYPYDTYMTHEDFDGLNGAQKEDAMMQSVLLEKELPGVPKQLPSSDTCELSYEMIQSRGMAINGNTLTVISPDASVTWKVNGAKSGETYVELCGFGFEGESTDVSVTASAVRKDAALGQKTLSYRTPKSPWPTGMQDFILNLGYSESAVDTVTLTFSRVGNYRINTLRFLSHPMEAYEAQAKARGEKVWKNEAIGTDRVSGEADLANGQLLLFTIPYDGGWSAYVDGEKQELLQANVMFCALPLTAGHHQIELVYHTPGLREGVLLSLLGALLFAGIVWKNRKIKLRNLNVFSHVF